jgi:hypothetical protein
MIFSRREFISLPAAFAAAAASHAASTGADPWRDRPKRWGQLTLVEDDPPKLNVQYWLDYFQRCQCDTVTLSAGGIVAYYPTKVPLHYRSKFLGSRDSFGDLARGCQKAGLTVVARIDPHACNQDMAKAHPEWLMVGASGKVRRHPVMPELYMTCPYGGYRRQFALDVIREIVATYQVDGIFANRWLSTSAFETCYCDYCKSSFRASYGHDLPKDANPRDPVWRDFTLWYHDQVFSLMQLWDGEIKKIKPASQYCPNNGGSAFNALDWKRFAEIAPLLIADHQGRSGTTPPWNASQLAKVYRSVAGGKPIIGSSGINLAVPQRWMKSEKPSPEQQIWMADGVAGGFIPKFSKFGGVMEDERWLPQVELFYKWVKASESYLHNRQPEAQVGVVYSQQTAHYYSGRDTKEEPSDANNGICQALIEARIPFEMVHDHKLDAASLSHFRLLVLPNIAALSAEQCAQLRAWVKSGGSLMATFATSLYDEWGNPRNDFGLGDIFGIRYRGRILGPLHNSYLAFEEKSGQRHPILNGFDDANYTVNCTRSVDVESTEAGYRGPITLIPGYPDLPMEMVYERVPRPHTPQVFVRQNGAFRTIYFPMDIDRTFWDILLEDHGRLLANAVRWAVGEPQPVTVTGPGVLDITVWKQTAATIIQMVNLTNPMMMRGQFREFIPVGPQVVRIQGHGSNVRRAHLQVAGQDLSVDRVNSAVSVTIPSIVDHEMLIVEWA